MKYIRRVPIFTIRVVYKSGYFHDFEVLRFKMSETSTSKAMDWDAISDSNMPIVIGIDDIAAVYQVGVRYKLSFGKEL